MLERIACRVERCGGTGWGGNGRGDHAWCMLEGWNLHGEGWVGMEEGELVGARKGELNTKASSFGDGLGRRGDEKLGRTWERAGN
jgi:hypothetical protein